MFLSQIKNKKTGRVFLQIVESYRKDGRSHQRKVKALGYLDELEKEYDDPIAHFKEVARRMTEEAKADKAQRVLTLSAAQRLVPGEVQRRNIGYLAFSTLFHHLEIDVFINNRRRHLDGKEDLNHIFQALVFERALDSAAKQGIPLMERYESSPELAHRSSGIFLSWRDDLIRHLDRLIKKRYGRENLLISYDLFRSGKDKPKIRMKLVLDRDGLPVTYELADGRRVMDGPAVPLNAGRTIHVADRRAMDDDAIGRIRMQQDGYVMHHTAREADERIMGWILRDEDADPPHERFVHRYDRDGRFMYKVKSRIAPRTITITDTNGQVAKHVIKERQVVVQSKRGRQESSLGEGFSVFYTNVIGLEEGEKSFGKSHRSTEDGFFLLDGTVTAEEILDIYQGLRRIEEASGMARTGPVDASTEEHIRFHAMIGFVALLLIRLLEKRLNWNYSAKTIRETLSKANGTPVDDFYIFNHFDEALKDIGTNLGIDFSRQNLTAAELRSLLASVKRRV